MRKVYPIMGLAALGGLGIGAVGKALTGVRDGSLAFGDTTDNLKLLADDNEYLRAVANRNVVLPRKKKKDEAQLKPVAVSDSNDAASPKAASEKAALVSMRNLGSPMTTFFRGSARPTGNETLADIPAASPLIAAAGFGGVATGLSLMRSRMKNQAKRKLSEERQKAKREFEAALIYEQEQARNRSKSAEERSELIDAVDDLFSAVDRYESLVKTAGLEKYVITAGGLLALLAGYHGFTKGYGSSQKAITRKAKEKLIGANTSYEDILKNIEARSVADSDLQVGEVEAPSFGSSYAKGATISK
ncbi:MAG: hypothetical protein FWH57_13490 [Oscillospiraceae bacterium]|nr:hypothetical protein [Oscillospiraceae bacterium]